MKSRTLLVTGGNRGIGKAIIEGLASSSEDVVLMGCRDLQEGQKTAADIGKNVQAERLNLANRDSLLNDLKDLMVRHPKIDVLVNNAGVLFEGDVLGCSVEDIEASFAVNTLGPIFLLKALLPGMVERDYGRIVNVSSGWGSFDEGLSGPFSYSVTKAALNAMTLSVANGLTGNVKVNSMCPGWVRTRMGGMLATRSSEQGADTAIWLANLPVDGPTGGVFRDRKLVEW
ncbi:MAG: SDR family NAD(P)-dependent oxidoreductase [Bdellovibrionales bacterium]|nr:SDR family NAD(P)-dependent oxidoreductase [Bdellovibrionales bacterium]